MGDSDGATGIRWRRVVAGALIGMLALEAAAQAGIYAFAGRPFDSLSLYRWSAYGLVRNNPKLTSPGFRIDAQGFRDVRDYSKAKPDTVFRVMLLGGSVLYSGLGGRKTLKEQGRVASDQTIAPFLAALIREDPDFSGAGIEVINAAVNFNRIVEVSTAYLGEYIDWDPDAIVVFGALNNFAAARRRGALARFQTALQRPHPWEDEFERLNNDTGLSATLERLWRSGAEHSAALALADKLAVAIAGRLVSVSLAASPRQARRAPAELETPAESEGYFRLYAAYADAMVAAARRMGQAIAFAWEPQLADMEGRKPMSAEELGMLATYRRPAALAAQYEMMRRRFLDYFAGEDVPVMDPTEPLGKHSETVFIDYAHYTAEGNRFVAGVLYAQLKPMLLAKFRQRFPAR